MSKNAGPDTNHTKMHYVRGGVPRSVPAGRVLVHNHVLHTVDQPHGANGFRAWTQAPADDLVECSCGWSGLPHQRKQWSDARCLLPGTWKELAARTAAGAAEQWFARVKPTSAPPAKLRT